MLAQMLQMEFDREFDTQLRREEKKFNGESKGKPILNPYTEERLISAKNKRQIYRGQLVISQRPACLSCGTYSV